jgi:hypothetical protein
MVKTCTTCKEAKPLDAFYHHPYGLHRRNSSCKVCRRAQEATRRAANPKGKAEYYAANKLHLNAYTKKWFEDNKDKKRLYDKVHRHKRREWLRETADEDPLSIQDVKALRDSQDNRCAYCRVELTDGAHIDHKIPLSRGGSHQLENLCWACPTCNMRKGRKTPEEFYAYRHERQVG